MTTLTPPERTKPRSELALFLKFLRGRIDRDVRVLGPHARHPKRLGKRVSQEELAEAIGVSRKWYVMLESALTTRTSTGLVDRVADALMTTPAERARLFHLAVPELGRVQLRDDSIVALEGVSHLRSLTRRIWAATSIEDVLTTASEQIADWFDGALLVSTTRRTESGLWEYPLNQQHRNNAVKVVEDMGELLTPELHAALNLYPRLANPGDVGTPDLWPRRVQRDILKIYARRRLPGLAWLYARVRSRTGFIGGFYISHEFGHSYSASDHAVFGAFVELASLALS